MLINLVPRVSSFYLWTKFRLKNRVTTVYLLQRKTNFFIHLCFWGRNPRQIKEHPSSEASLENKKSFSDLFTFVYTRLHFSTIFYIYLDSCSDLSSGSSTVVYIRLDSSSDSSTLLYTPRLHWSALVYIRLLTRLCF